MFEKLLICVFFFFLLISESSFYISFALFFSFFFFNFLFFRRSNSRLNRCRTFFLQQQHFVQRSDFFRFVALYFLYSSHNVSSENHSFMFSSKRNLLRINFIVFFFRESFFFQFFFSVVSIFLFRFLSSL